MEFKVGQHFVNRAYSMMRHVEVLDVEPIYTVNKSGKRKLQSTVLHMHDHTVKYFDSCRRFSITSDLFEDLLRRQIFSLRDEA